MGLNPEVFHGKDTQSASHRPEQETEENGIPEGLLSGHASQGDGFGGSLGVLMMLPVGNATQVVNAQHGPQQGKTEDERIAPRHDMTAHEEGREKHGEERPSIHEGMIQRDKAAPHLTTHHTRNPRQESRRGDAP